MTVTEIHSAQQFSQTVLQESKLVVVDYFATCMFRMNQDGNGEYLMMNFKISIINTIL